MRINANSGAVTTFTHFDNIAFTAGATTYLQVYATSLYLTASGCSVRVGERRRRAADQQRQADRQRHRRRRDASGGRPATCHANQTTHGYCHDSWKSDDDTDSDGVGNLRRGTTRWCSSCARPH